MMASSSDNRAFLEGTFKPKCYSQGKKVPEIGERQSQISTTVNAPEIAAKISELLN
jgi:hypothetical protein